MTKKEFAVLKESKKYRYIVAAVIAVISLVLFAIGFFFCKIELSDYIGDGQYEYKTFTFAQCLSESVEGIIVLVLFGIMLISIILRFVDIKMGFKFLIFFQIFFGLGILPCTGLLAGLCMLYAQAATWLVVAAAIISCMGAALLNFIIKAVLFLPEALTTCFKNIVHFFSQITNFHYKGKSPISYFGKIVEVFVQIMLLPVSIFIQGLFVPYSLFGFCWIGDLIIKHMFYLELKGEKDEKVEYEGEVTKTVVKKTVEHDIKDNYGNKIGTYESLDDCVEYSGGGYVKDDQRKDAFKNGFFVLPLRIVSLVLSVIALIVPKMYVKVTKPKVENRFVYKYFRYIDLIIFEE